MAPLMIRYWRLYCQRSHQTRESGLLLSQHVLELSIRRFRTRQHWIVFANAAIRSWTQAKSRAEKLWRCHSLDDYWDTATPYATSRDPSSNTFFTLLASTSPGIRVPSSQLLNTRTFECILQKLDKIHGHIRAISGSKVHESISFMLLTTTLQNNLFSEGIAFFCVLSYNICIDFSPSCFTRSQQPDQVITNLTNKPRIVVTNFYTSAPPDQDLVVHF